MKSVTTRLKSGGLHEHHVVATWNLGNHLSICLQTQETKKAQGNRETRGNQETRGNRETRGNQETRGNLV